MLGRIGATSGVTHLFFCARPLLGCCWWHLGGGRHTSSSTRRDRRSPNKMAGLPIPELVQPQPPSSPPPPVSVAQQQRQQQQPSGGRRPRGSLSLSHTIPHIPVETLSSRLDSSQRCPVDRRRGVCLCPTRRTGEQQNKYPPLAGLIPPSPGGARARLVFRDGSRRLLLAARLAEVVVLSSFPLPPLAPVLLFFVCCLVTCLPHVPTDTSRDTWEDERECRLSLVSPGERCCSGGICLCQ